MEDQVMNIKDVFMTSLGEFWNTIATGFPKFLFAVLILIIGYFIAKLIASAIRKALQLVKFDTIADKIELDQLLEKVNVKTTPSNIVAKFVYYLIMLAVIVTASETLGWKVISEQITDLMDLMPRLFAAVAVFFIGFYFANFIKKLIAGATSSLSPMASTISTNFVYYFLLFIVSITALTQAGISTSVITSNFAIILGAILLGIALAFGLGAPNIVRDMMSSLLGKKYFEKGQTISIEGITGVIEDIDVSSVVINTGSEKVILPAQKLLSEKVTIK